MINCLTTYIGLKNVEDNPTSGLYLNDVQGITTDQFELTREIEENDGAVEAWQSLENRAIRLFEMDLMVKMQKYFKGYNLISSSVSGFVDDNNIADHGSGKYAGWLYDFSNYSPNLTLQINDVKIHLSAAQNFNIKIFDANNGDELFTTAVTGVKGLNTVKILKEYSVYEYNKIFIGYDTVEPYRIYTDLDVPSTMSQGNYSTSATVLAENLSASESGLIVRSNAKCSLEHFVCSRLELFTQPFLHKLAIEFLRHSKYSDVLNRYTLLDLPMRNEIIAEYKLAYDDMIEGIFHDLKVPDDGICFICNKAISKRVLIP